MFLFFFTISLKAQEKIISGIITDAGTKQPVEFATVQLQQADSILNSTVTDRKGKFSLQTSDISRRQCYITNELYWI